MSGGEPLVWEGSGVIQQIAIWLLTYALHSTVGVVLTLWMLRYLSLSAVERRHMWQLLLALPPLTSLYVQFAGLWEGWRWSPISLSKPQLLAPDGEVGVLLYLREQSDLKVLSTTAMVLVFAWLVGALVNVVRIGLGLRRLSAQLADRVPCPNSKLDSCLQELVQRSHRRLPVRLSASSNISNPLVLGRNEICLPECLLSELSEAELVAILGHELAHVEKKDGLLFPVLGLLSAVFWMHPYNWWLCARWREDTELCCDERAVELNISATSLARAIERVASLGESQGLTLVPAMLARRGALARVMRLLEQGFGESPPEKSARWSPVAFVAVAAVFTPRAALSHGGYSSTTESGNLRVLIEQPVLAESSRWLGSEPEPDLAAYDVMVKQFTRRAAHLQEELNASRVHGTLASPQVDSQRAEELSQQLRHLRARQALAQENFEIAWHKWERESSASSAHKEEL